MVISRMSPELLILNKSIIALATVLLEEPSREMVSAHFIEDLSPSDINALTQLLYIPRGTYPSKPWLHTQKTLLSTFPPTLLRPTSTLLRLAMHLPFTPPVALLCPAHKPLNGHLIRRIFLAITAEVTTRQDRLQSQVGADAALHAFIRRLQAINSLWLAPEIYRVLFQARPEEPRPEPVPSACEACILACIGGDAAILSDLRASVRARIKKHRAPPRLLTLLESWIGGLGLGLRFSSEVRARSDCDAKMIKAARRRVWKAKKRQRQGDGTDSDIACAASMGSKQIEEAASHCTQWGDYAECYASGGDDRGNHQDHDHDHGHHHIDGEVLAVEDDGFDFEADIISFYRRIVSSTISLAPSQLPQQANEYPDLATIHKIHPTFQQSLLRYDSLSPVPAPLSSQQSLPSHSSDNTNNSSARSLLSLAPRSTCSSWYTQSICSSAEQAEEPFPTDLQQIAEEQARAYRDLLEMMDRT